MEIPERRVIGALLLLLGISLFAVGIYREQLAKMLETLKAIL